MLNGIEVLIHSSIRIKRDITIYIDPYNIKGEYNDADFIFITHSHYDHFSIEDIDKVKKNSSVIIVPSDLKDSVNGFAREDILVVEPNKSYEFRGLKFSTVPAYNLTKPFHPKSKQWVGYIINIDGIKYYIAGDTDDTPEIESVRCDVAFVPIGGTYTMDYLEASNFINKIRPLYAVPIHYGSIVGTKDDAKRFVSNLDEGINGKILMK